VSLVTCRATIAQESAWRNEKPLSWQRLKGDSDKPLLFSTGVVGQEMELAITNQCLICDRTPKQ
jgi:hypothetical protein